MPLMMLRLIQKQFWNILKIVIQIFINLDRHIEYAILNFLYLKISNKRPQKPLINNFQVILINV